jgi:hypothetical protein
MDVNAVPPGPENMPTGPAVYGALSPSRAPARSSARSGATGYEAFLQLERAELDRLTGDEASREQALREAHQLFLELDAMARAEQVAREIGR